MFLNNIKYKNLVTLNIAFSNLIKIGDEIETREDVSIKNQST